jgi:hypothetical protein
MLHTVIISGVFGLSVAVIGSISQNEIILFIGLASITFALGISVCMARWQSYLSKRGTIT